MILYLKRSNQGPLLYLSPRYCAIPMVAKFLVGELQPPITTVQCVISN